MCAGWPDEVKSVRACVELTLQVYNSKLALPNPAVRRLRLAQQGDRAFVKIRGVYPTHALTHPPRSHGPP